MYSGMSIRMAQELKLNESSAASSEEDNDDDEENEDECESERRLTWLGCFMVDRYSGGNKRRCFL